MNTLLILTLLFISVSTDRIIMADFYYEGERQIHQSPFGYSVVCDKLDSLVDPIREYWSCNETILNYKMVKKGDKVDLKIHDSSRQQRIVNYLRIIDNLNYIGLLYGIPDIIIVCKDLKVCRQYQGILGHIMNHNVNEELKLNPWV